MRMPYRWIVGFLVLLQVLATIFFVGDILLTMLGIHRRPIPWEMREMIEIGAAVSLVLGVVLGVFVLVHMSRRTRRLEDQLRIAAGALEEIIRERFDAWGLTPAERDVALFAIKGLTTKEIAALRRTSEGTVKAQTNAIYRKAGVSSRAQLLGLFVEELLEGSVSERMQSAETASLEEAGAREEAREQEGRRRVAVASRG